MNVPDLLQFDWDEGNIEKSWKKHKVFYKEAEEIFFNRPIKIFRDRKHSQAEERFIALGVTNEKRKLQVVFTIREKKLRVISARNQSVKEEKLYEKTNE